MDGQYHDLTIIFNRVTDGDKIVIRGLDHKLSEDTRIIDAVNLLNLAFQRGNNKSIIKSIMID